MLLMICNVINLPLMTPIIRGWGMADFMCKDCSYNVCNQLQRLHNIYKHFYYV